MFPSLSFLISTCPDFASVTACLIFSDTEPSLGFGINPFGPKTFPIGKVLGPKGLMPNPKLGSVSENIKQAVTDAKSGQVEIRNDKDGNIGVSIGKKSFSDDQLLKNYNAIIDALEKEKSNNTLKGDLIKGVFATSTMGVSYKVKLGKSI